MKLCGMEPFNSYKKIFPENNKFHLIINHEKLRQKLKAPWSKIPPCNDLSSLIDYLKDYLSCSFGCKGLDNDITGQRRICLVCN